MGISCFKKTPHSAYQDYLSPATLELKQQWAPLRLFKLKKLFDSNSQLTPKYLSYEGFISMFPEMTERAHGYQETQRRRFFSLFDRNGTQMMQWNQFFEALSLFYYGPQQSVAAILFALYDESLSLRLTRTQLEELLQQNSWLLQEQYEDQLLNNLQDLVNPQGLDVGEWIERSLVWIDYQKMRRLFSVFMQEQLQRDLGENFSELNEVWDEYKGRSVGYMINFKWFQAWSIYMYKQYGCEVNSLSSYMTYNKTLKSLKTKKTIKSLKSGKSINSGISHKRLHDGYRLRKLTLARNPSFLSHYNLIHNNIGDKPTEISNNLLQGEYSQILAPGLLQNLDYVIVSEEVWRRLKLIYGAYPQFRRSGDREIVQIYPKTFKVYTKILKGKIDYNQQKTCQFSCNLMLDYLMTKVLSCDKASILQNKYFFKTCTINRWQQLKTLSIRVSDLTSQQLVFLAVVDAQQRQIFKQKNCRLASNIDELHIGDQFKYFDGTERGRNAILMGQNNHKIIVHFKGLPYIYDACLDSDTFKERAVLIKQKTQGHKRVRMQESIMSPIPDYTGLGFVNGLLLVVFNNDSLDRYFKHIGVKQGKPQNFIEYLSLIYHMVTSGGTVLPAAIADFMRYYFPNYFHFELTMAESFLETFFTTFQEELSQIDNSSPFNPIRQYLIEVEKNVSCSSCQQVSSQTSQSLTVCLPLVQQDIYHFQVVYVPFAYSLNQIQQTRYAFQLPHGSNFSDYKQAFERVSFLKQANYVLVEIYGNNIIKCYMNALPQASLEQLLLRQDDKMFAFQLCLKMDNFIADHYTSDTTVKLRSLREGQFIDFQTPAKKITGTLKKFKSPSLQKLQKEELAIKWSYGRIIDTKIENYTHRIMVKVQYRNIYGQKAHIQLDPQTYNVAPFPTQSYQFAQHYHIRCLQRVYNEVANEMELCSQPFVIMVASWMRLRQIQLLIYQQVRQQIAPEGRFRVMEAEGSSKSLKKDKMKKFRQYLNRGKPYQLRFTDQEGRCSQCCKIQKSVVLQGQQDFICEGCEKLLNPDQPIFSMIRPYQIKICIDWHSSLAFIPPTAVDDTSCYSVKNQNKWSQTLQKCIQRRFTSTHDQDICENCLEQGRITSQQTIINNPERMVITLERLNQEGYRRVNREVINFQIDDMEFNGEIYQLVGAISLGSRRWPLQYVTYIRDKSKWLEYQSDSFRVVKKAVLQRSTAFVLFYRKGTLSSIIK